MSSLNPLEILVTIGGAVIAFFLRDLFSRFNKLETKVENTIIKYNQEFGKLVGKVNSIDLKTSGELKRLEEIMEMHHKIITDKIEELQRILERNEKNK